MSADVCRWILPHRDLHDCACTCALLLDHKGRHQCSVQVIAVKFAPPVVTLHESEEL